MNPKKYSKGSSNISIVIPAEMTEKLNDLAIKSGKSRNQIIREAIEKTLEKETEK